MVEHSAYVGLDVHKEAISVPVALPVRENSVIRGEIRHQRSSLRRLVGRLCPMARSSASAVKRVPAGTTCTTVELRVHPQPKGRAWIKLPPEGARASALPDSRWTQAHFRWLEEQAFRHQVQQVVFQEYVDVVLEAQRRVAGLEDQIRLAMQSWPLQPVVETLISLCGVDVITAVTVLAETGDQTRFDSPRRLMSCPGLVPSAELLGNASPPGQDHQDRQQPCASGSGGNGVELPFPGPQDGSTASQGCCCPASGSGAGLGGFAPAIDCSRMPASPIAR